MTEPLYQIDSYLKEFSARVTAVDGQRVALDRTALYATGGGQPHDTGTLGDGARTWEVTEVRREGEDIWHTLRGDGMPSVGDTLSGQVDWQRRYRLMRTHTALHVLSGIVFTGFGAKVTGGNISEPGVARMDFELDAMSAEFGREVEERLNEALAADAPVHVSFLPRAEALADPDLIRTKVNLIPESVDPIRVVDIEGLDKQADGGTHVRSTAEVGRVRVTKTESKGKAFKRMRIELV